MDNAPTDNRPFDPDIQPTDYSATDMLNDNEEPFSFRPMRRTAKSLARETCLEILRNGERGVLSVLGDGGYPYGIPLNYIFRDGNIFFHGALRGHKVDAIERCDKASFCVMDTPTKKDGNWWYTTRSVICFGRIWTVQDKDVAYHTLLSLGRKYFPLEDIVQKEMGAAPRTRVLCLNIEHMSGKWVNEK